MRKIIKKRFQGTHARFISIVTDGQAKTERRDAIACVSYMKSSQSISIFFSFVCVLLRAATQTGFAKIAAHTLFAITII